MKARIAGIGFALLVAGCGLLQGERPGLHVSNGTTLVVVLIVNGQAVGEYRPGVDGPDVEETLLPPLPWLVEARTVNGRLLSSIVIEPGHVFRTTHPDGTVEISTPLGREDLSCGRLDIWAGDVPPRGPAPGPGVPGDCEP